MFDAIKSLTINIKSLDVNKLMHDALEDKQVQAQILDLNTQEQLYERGVNAEGESLGNYSGVTAQYKSLTGQRFDHITLNDTGDFYKSFRFVNQKKQFKIVADTLKEGSDLNEQFPNILGLTNESKAEVNSMVVDDIRKGIKMALRK